MRASNLQTGKREKKGKTILERGLVEMKIRGCRRVSKKKEQERRATLRIPIGDGGIELHPYKDILSEEEKLRRGNPAPRKHPFKSLFAACVLFYHRQITFA